MKKTLFILWVFIAITSVTVVYVAFSIQSLKQSLSNAQNLVSELITSEAEAVLSTIRDDVLNGNHSQVEVTFARVRGNGHFVALHMKPVSGEPFFFPKSYQAGGSAAKVERTIRFSDDGPLWGNVDFIYDSSAVDKLKGEIVDQFLRSLYFIFGLILVTVASLLYFLFKITDSILVAFEASIKGSGSVFRNISWFDPRGIWTPAYRRVTEVGIDYKKHRDKVELLREKEASFRAIAQIAHDLRTPLSGVKIAMDKLRGTNERAFDVGSRSLERAEAILNESLKTWRKGTVPNTTEISADAPECNVANVIREVVDEYRLRIPDLDFSVSMTAHTSFRIRISSEDMARIFQSTLNNSLDAQMGSPRPKVIVNLEHNEGFLFIRLRDFGSGFSETALRRAFEDGYSETRNLKGSGSGMGLFDIRQRLLANGGLVALANESDPPGAKVTIIFPELR